MNKVRTGRVYEDKTAEYLQSLGYRILERNFRSGIGEIDLIAKDQDTIVFIEVKYRKNAQYGFPEEAVAAGKIRKITSTACYYLMRHQIPENVPVRFDVAAFEGNRFRYIRAAFDPQI